MLIAPVTQNVEVWEKIEMERIIRVKANLPG
ncbi:MAG: hypothetical protein JWN76_2396 [Chitinophagaceae bacterium]|nr:hypothetical protein [Chitinophagaceae bacterium]